MKTYLLQINSIKIRTTIFPTGIIEDKFYATIYYDFSNLKAQVVNILKINTATVFRLYTIVAVLMLFYRES